jgi:DUF3102 family protein
MVETVSLDPNGLAALATKIRDYHKQVEEAAKNLVQKAMMAGSALTEAKRQVRQEAGHGGWLPWLKKECQLSERTAQRYMELAKGKSKLEQKLREDKSVTMADLTISEALRLIRDDGGNTDETGDEGKYEKARATLIKKLRKLPTDDIEEAVARTIAALQEIAAEFKKPVSKAA